MGPLLNDVLEKDSKLSKLREDEELEGEDVLEILKKQSELLKKAHRIIDSRPELLSNLNVDKAKKNLACR